MEELNEINLYDFTNVKSYSEKKILDKNRNVVKKIITIEYDKIEELEITKKGE